MTASPIAGRRAVAGLVEYCTERVLPAVFAAVPPPVITAVAGVNPVSAYYHIVSDNDVPHVKQLYPFRSRAEFEADLDEFCRRFSVVSVADLLQSLDGGRPLPRNALLLTFDDGFREMYDVVAPILLRRGLPATFFLLSGCLDNRDMAHHNKISLVLDHLQRHGLEVASQRAWEILCEAGIDGPSLPAALLSIDYPRRVVIDRVAAAVGCSVDEYLARREPYLTSTQVRTLLAQGFSIGSHSIDHPMYSRLTVDEQIRQTLVSTRMLRERFELPYGVFAFPHGDDCVGGQFFEGISADREVLLTFGTAGIATDRRPRHFQRFSTENTRRPAAPVLGRCYARSVYKTWLGRLASAAASGRVSAGNA